MSTAGKALRPRYRSVTTDVHRAQRTARASPVNEVHRARLLLFFLTLPSQAVSPRAAWPCPCPRCSQQRGPRAACCMDGSRESTTDRSARRDTARAPFAGGRRGAEHDQGCAVVRELERGVAGVRDPKPARTATRRRYSAAWCAELASRPDTTCGEPEPGRGETPRGEAAYALAESQRLPGFRQPAGRRLGRPRAGKEPFPRGFVWTSCPRSVENRPKCAARYVRVPARGGPRSKAYDPCARMDTRGRLSCYPGRTTRCR